jgi:hypothetical protein
MLRTLIGGHVQRLSVARIGDREVALLQVRVPGESAHIVVAGGSGGGAGVGVVDAEGRARLREAMRAAQSPSQARWRARIEGARVVAAGERAMTFSREQKLWVAQVEPAGGLALVEQEAPVQVAPEHLRSLVRQAPPAGEAADFGALEARGAAIARELGRAGVEGRREALRRGLAKAIARVARRAEAVRGDLTRAESADELAHRAQLFVAHAARAPRGATQLVAVDWSTGEAREVAMKLDPARGAQTQIDALFRRARRLKDGARIARGRLDDAERMLASLRALAESLQQEEETPDLDAIEARARAAAPRDFKLAPAAASSSRQSEQTPRPPYRVFLSASGDHRILVGRGAEKNDALTFHVARPHDLWLHAKNRAGAHVIVALEKGASCPADLLVEAAHLAAHFSEARDERVVEVQYTPRRYLRKPRGSAPGLVVVDREKVMALRREDELLRQLLEREVEG